VIDHVDIRPSDFDASRRFYDTVLGVLGKARTHIEDNFAEWREFSIHSDGQPVTRRLHIAFYAPSHEEVDAFHRTGVEAGYASDGEPGPRPQYAPEYYGAFLLDPDGNSVEAVYVAKERERGQIDHLWLRVADVEASTRFYETIAPHAGFEVRKHNADHTQLAGPKGSFSLVRGDEPTEHVHIAFPAQSNATVDAFHAAAIAAGYTDHGGPGERAHYHAGYYGAFVLDPDGNNVEVVNHNR
jgi:catechol 2,3-dioxygenase-like lactoylglutathione lyase family enzyme